VGKWIGLFSRGLWLSSYAYYTHISTNVYFVNMYSDAGKYYYYYYYLYVPKRVYMCVLYAFIGRGRTGICKKPFGSFRRGLCRKGVDLFYVSPCSLSHTHTHLYIGIHYPLVAYTRVVSATSFILSVVRGARVLRYGAAGR